MEKKQNDNGIQRSDNKSKQESSKDYSKKETNPNNPIANKSQLPEVNQNHKPKSAQKNSDTDVMELDEDDNTELKKSDKKNYGDTESKNGSSPMDSKKKNK